MPTPMMQQYFQIKDEYKDYLLFYRLGDFYEMFYDDAKTVSAELDLVLTGKSCGEEERAPMCGIPYHSVDSYIPKLVEKGYKIAICEQTEDPATAKGLVKRDVVRIITPGTLTQSEYLKDSANNYLASLYFAGSNAAISFCDISTGEVYATLCEDDTNASSSVIDQLALYSPSELITNATESDAPEIFKFINTTLKCSLNAGQSSYFDRESAEDVIIENANENALSLGIERTSPILPALSALFIYLRETQKTELKNIKKINLYSRSAFLSLDASTRRNLEICETMRTKTKKGSLLGILDKTKTSGGARTLRRWLEAPLTNCLYIKNRQDAVAYFSSHEMFRDDVRTLLSSVHDTERLLTKVIYQTCSARDLKALEKTLGVIPSLKELIVKSDSPQLQAMGEKLLALNDLKSLIEASISDEPPFSVREGDIIKDGYHKDVDELRLIIKDSKKYLAAIEQSERELTGIKNLKVGYNRVFGYYIEVTKSMLDNVPDRYIRRQTLTGAERYVTNELKDVEGKVLGAKDKIQALEYELFVKVCDRVREAKEQLQQNAVLLSTIDVYASLGEVAAKNSYVCPEVDYSDKLQLDNSRHPIVEQYAQTLFVPNDVNLDCAENRLNIITGPNMAGKSTYMRQVALIVIMAQIGSFVPAKYARIGIVDKIYTRIGASDDLSQGSSTFMLEMKEVAAILNGATPKSLIIYDEIGRGTSTFDGMSIARAVLEYTAQKIMAKTLFATHYHELSELEGVIKGVKNYNIAAKKRGDDIIFLRKIIAGSADDSYGIEVAKLAGVPGEVINLAKKYLKMLESDSPQKHPAPPTQSDEGSFTMGGALSQSIIDEMKKIDVNVLTPIEALEKLHELCKEARSI